MISVPVILLVIGFAFGIGCFVFAVLGAQ